MGIPVRFAIDIIVDEGDAEEVAASIGRARKQIGDFAKDVIVHDDDNVDSERLKIRTAAGAAHVHSMGGYCGTCDKYTAKEFLNPVD
jgi:hypothetical protein